MENRDMTERKPLERKQVIVRPCHDCGGTMKGTRGRYHYNECGLNNICLVNVVVFECECGRRVPEIPAISELHRVIAFQLLKKPSLLVGEEIRFLRKLAGLNQRELAEIMGVDPTTPSKWESSSAGKDNDRLLRTICFLGMIQHFSAGRDTQNVRAMSNQFRDLDVREILKSIEDEDTGPTSLKLENNPMATGTDSWFLPGSGNGEGQRAH
jgi:transcriptional regulator with XRE-family HTH domain